MTNLSGKDFLTFKDKDFAIRKFEDHIKEVKRLIPQERLLVLEVKDGWEPLCTFLEEEIPAVPFPNSNKKKNFNTWAKSIVKDVLQ